MTEQKPTRPIELDCKSSSVINDDADETPTSDDHAAGVRRALAEFAESVKAGRHAQPKRRVWRGRRASR